MSLPRLSGGLALAVAVVVAVAPATAPAAAPKANGYYVSSNAKSARGFASLIVFRHRIIVATGLLPLKKAGKTCVPRVSPKSRLFIFVLKPKRAVRAKRDGSFSVSGKTKDTKLDVTLSGRFTSSTRAVFEVTASSSESGCEGSFTARTKYVPAKR